MANPNVALVVIALVLAPAALIARCNPSLPECTAACGDRGVARFDSGICECTHGEDADPPLDPSLDPNPNPRSP